MCSFIPLLQGEADLSHLRKGLVFRNHLQGDKVLGPSRSGISADGCFSVFQSPQQILKHVNFFWLMSFHSFAICIPFKETQTSHGTGWMRKRWEDE